MSPNDLETLVTYNTAFEAVASLRLVSPGAATEGVTLFFRQKMTAFLGLVLKSDYTFL